MTRVLLVEDDMWRAELEAQRLIEAGYEVVHAAHAQAAITRIDEVLPDIVVADLLLTGTTAIALLHELQSYTDTKDIPVILYTNVADTLSLAALRPYGVRRIIDKATMQGDEVAVAVRSVLA